MATKAMISTSLALGERAPLTADMALQRAWQLYITLLTLPFIVFVFTMWALLFSEEAVRTDFGRTWFFGTMIYIGLAVPSAFFVRHRLFRQYMAGHPVQPRDYLLGMSLVWLSIELGGLAALAGCIISHALLPNLIAALVAFVLFMPLWPNGHAMSRPLINERDPHDYEDPR